MPEQTAPKKVPRSCCQDERGGCVKAAQKKNQATARSGKKVKGSLRVPDRMGFRGGFQTL